MTQQQFDEDDRWQREMRDAILRPMLYEANYAGRYEFIDPDDERAIGGCDTIAAGKRIDEKIVRYPKDRDQPYDAFALEILSCSNEGRERAGWIYTNNVDYILYCFASKDGNTLTCYRIAFPELKAWWIANDHNRWPLWRSDQINKTVCCVVPIAVVEANVPTKRFVYSRPGVAPAPGLAPALAPPVTDMAGFVGYDADGNFMHYCHCGKFGAFGVGVKLLKGRLGTWYCLQHRIEKPELPPTASSLL